MLGRVQTIAAARRVSGNRAIVDLVDDAIQAYDQRRIAFFELADTLQKSTNAPGAERLREEMARMTFGS